ncbi:MAG: lipid II flippase MurJ [Anaeromyxobacteraceae bacterium]
MKLVATGKELLVANRFGTSDSLDAYLIAFLLPSFLINVLGGPLAVSLVPAYVRARRSTGQDAAQRLLGNSLVLAIGAFCAIALTLGLASPWLIPVLGSSFSTEKQELTRRLFFLLLPALVLPAVNTTLGALLNANEKFAVPALAPIVTPLLTSALLGVGRDRFGVTILVVGTLAGPVVETLVLGAAVRRLGVQPIPLWRGLDHETKTVFTAYGSFLLAAALSSSSTVVDQAFAASLGGGGVSILGYANKVPSVLLSVSAGLWTSALTFFSRAVSTGDLEGVRRTIRRYTVITVAATIPVTIAFMFLSTPLVRLLFQRGAFSSEDTASVALVQACYVAQLPLYVLGMLHQRLAVALSAQRAILVGSVLNLVVNVVLDLVLMRFWGLAGIALSSVAVCLASFLFLRAATERALMARAS